MANEIYKLRTWATILQDIIKEYPGMTYEQGVKAAIEWLQGYGENPME